MTVYNAPIKDMQFLLHDVLNVTASSVPGYDELDTDFTNAILEEAGKIAGEVLQPKPQEHTSRVRILWKTVSQS